MGLIKIEGKEISLDDAIINAGIPAIRAALSVDFPDVENADIRIVTPARAGAPKVATVVKRGTGKGLKLDIYGGGAESGFKAHGEYEPGVDPELKPCPFCGNRNIAVSNTHAAFYRAECHECSAQGPRGDAGPGGSRKIGTKENCERLHTTAFLAAVGLWNTRMVEGTRTPRKDKWFERPGSSNEVAAGGAGIR